MLSSVYHLLFTESEDVDKVVLMMHITVFVAIMIAIW